MDQDSTEYGNTSESTEGGTDVETVRARRAVDEWSDHKTDKDKAMKLEQPGGVKPGHGTVPLDVEHSPFA